MQARTPRPGPDDMLAFRIHPPCVNGTRVHPKDEQAFGTPVRLHQAVDRLAEWKCTYRLAQFNPPTRSFGRTHHTCGTCEPMTAKRHSRSATRSRGQGTPLWVRSEHRRLDRPTERRQSLRDWPPRVPPAADRRTCRASRAERRRRSRLPITPSSPGVAGWATSGDRLRSRVYDPAPSTEWTNA